MRAQALTIGLSAALGIGCGGEDDGRSTGPAGPGVNASGGSSSGGDGDSSPDDGGRLDVPADTTGMQPGDDEECASYSEAAQSMLQPADIIFIVDNSGSMDFEASAVQSNLNTFSAQIAASGVDARVSLISSYPGNGNGICIEPPLGVGGCNGADNNPPLFTHIDQQVSSTNALRMLLDHFASWGPMVRPESGLHIVIVSDDESDLPAADFDAQLKALNPDFVDYKLHGIVCLTNCPETARIGDTYIALGMQTGGLLSDLCDQNFQPVFDLLATEVISGSVLSCEWDVPQPEGEDELDPDQVNVEFSDGPDTEIIGRVDNPSQCPNVTDGWYYDNAANPTKILACPQTCDRIQDVMDAQINITLGCATVPAG